MNDREAEKERNRVRRLVDRWIDRAGLSGWLIHIEYDRSSPDERSDRGARVAAQALVSWPYREATLTFWLLTTVDLDADGLEYCVVHELMHIQVNEMRDDQAENFDHEERVCTELARVLVRAYQTKS